MASYLATLIPYASIVGIPFVILLLSAVIHAAVHRKPMAEYIHEVPPRLALAALGLLLTAYFSQGSFLSASLGSQREVGFVLVALIYVGLYVVCERCYAAAKGGGSGRLATTLGGSLSYGLATLSVRLAQS